MLQFLIVLRDGLHFQTTDGQAADFHPGDIVLLDDTTGRGHHTTMLGDNDSWVLAVALD